MKLAYGVFLFVILTLLMPVAAQEVVLTISAPITQGDVAKAREVAKQNAIKQVLQQQGSFSYQQESKNGVLLEEQLNWNSQAEVEQMLVLAEREYDDRIELDLIITLRASFESQCNNPTKAAVVIPRAQVRYREQLVPGGLYELDAAIARILTATLNGESSALFGVAQDQIRIDYIHGTQEWPRSLGQQTQTQYSLAIVIDDLALTRPERLLGLFERGGNRQIAFDATLYDNFSNQQVWQQRYRSQGDWPFGRQEQPDVATEQFWQTDFGTQLLSLLKQLAQDLDNQYACQPIQGRILSKQNDRVTLDLGRQHGLKAGDTLTVLMQSDNWPQANPKYTITLLQVLPNSSMAQIDRQGASVGIQVGDWVQK